MSVVVPVYNDPEGVETTLESLSEQSYPDERYEIIVVDNGSSDRTPEVVRHIADSHGPIRALTEPNGGSYTARNAGIREAMGTILSFVDADMTVDPDWLATLVNRMEATGAAYLGCDVRLPGSADGASIPERYNRHTAFPVRDYIVDQDFAPTCCLTVRREVFEDVGLFDARLVSSGDREFGNRVAKAGYDLEFAPEVTMTHPPRTSLDELLRKAVRIGRGTYQIRRYYPDRYGHPSMLVVNPLTYTPPTPWTMRKRFHQWGALSHSERLAFVLLGWALTLAMAYGKLSEFAIDRK